jgi:hypothetical protein
MVQHTSTFAIFKIDMPSTTAASPSLLQNHQQQEESIGLYFLAVLPYDDTLYSLSSLPTRDNNNDDENKSVKSNFKDETYSSLHNQLINLSSITSLMSLLNHKTVPHDHDRTGVVLEY